MKKRRKMSHHGSKRLFAATAPKVHVKNVRPPVMRGGYRA